MLRNILLVLLVVFLLAAGWFLLRTYQAYKSDTDPDKTFFGPRLSHTTVDIREVTAERADMLVYMRLNNHVPIGFTADSLEYELFISDVSVMRNTWNKGMKVKGSDTSVIGLPVTIYYDDLDKVLKKMEARNRDSVEYRMEATVHTRFFLKKRFDFTIKRYWPLVYIPEVKNNGISIDSLNLKRAALIFNAGIVNKNFFDIKIRNLDYEFELEDNEMVTGRIEGLTAIKANATTDIDVPVRLSFKEARQSLGELIKKGGGAAYTLRLIFTVESKKNVADDTRVSVTLKDTVRSTAEIIKERRKK
jgi:LEA14-like dessication related protein